MEPESTYTLVREDREFPHLFWAFFWLIIFWPALLVWVGLGYSRTRYTVIIHEDGKSTMKIMDKHEYTQTKFNLKEEK